MKISKRLNRDSKNYIILSEDPTKIEIGNSKKKPYAWQRKTNNNQNILNVMYKW